MLRLVNLRRPYIKINFYVKRFICIPILNMFMLFFITMRICWSIGHFKLVSSFVNSKPPGRKMVKILKPKKSEQHANAKFCCFVDNSRHKRVGLLFFGCWHHKSVGCVAHLCFLRIPVLHNNICLQVDKRKQNLGKYNTSSICSEFYKICLCLMVGIANASSALQVAITTNSRSVKKLFCNHLVVTFFVNSLQVDRKQN